MKSNVRHQDSVLTQSRHLTAPAVQTEQLPEEQQQKNPRSALWLFALASAIGFIALFVGVTRKSDSTKIDLTNVEQRRKLEASVNRHIQMTNRKIEIDKERIKVEAAFAIPRVGNLVSNRKEIQNTGLDLRGDRREYNSARDVDRRGESSQAIYAADVVHNDMAQAELLRHAEEARNKEFARQYVEDARRRGYDVQVDASYRIISVKELPPGSIKEASGEAYR